MFREGLKKQARPGATMKNLKLGLGSGSTLEARARLRLKKIRLVTPKSCFKNINRLDGMKSILMSAVIANY